MKLELVSEHKQYVDSTKEIIISNNGVTYTISSDFLGIRIENDHPKGINIYPTDDKNHIIIR